MVYLLHDETFTDTMRRGFETLCSRYSQEFCPVRAYIEPETARNIPQDFTVATAYRLLLPDLLTDSKVVYIDCDVIVNLDIAELYPVEMDDCPFAVVQDPWLTMSGYFNSGVMLWNFDWLRKNNSELLSECIALITRNKYKYPDQDALNAVCAENSLRLAYIDDKFNFLPTPGRSRFALDFYKGKILHFAGDKPWKIFSSVGLWYWNYYAKAFPERDVFAKILMLEPERYASTIAFMLSHPKIRRWNRRLMDLKEKGLWRSIVKRLRPQ